MNYRREKEKVYKKKFTNFHLFGPKQADPKKTNSLQNLNLYSLIVQAFFEFLKEINGKMKKQAGAELCQA